MTTLHPQRRAVLPDEPPRTHDDIDRARTVSLMAAEDALTSGPRIHPTRTGGVVLLRPALDCLDRRPAEPDEDEPVEEGSLRAHVMECFVIGPPLVDPADEAEPTWVGEHQGRDPELLFLSEALWRVEETERSAVIADHLEALDTLVRHHRIVSGDPLAGEHPQPVCPLCIVDPESHAESLSVAIVNRTGELVDAVAMYGPSVLVVGDGPRRRPRRRPR